MNKTPKPSPEVAYWTGHIPTYVTPQQADWRRRAAALRERIETLHIKDPDREELKQEYYAVLCECPNREGKAVL